MKSQFVTVTVIILSLLFFWACSSSDSGGDNFGENDTLGDDWPLLLLESFTYADTVSPDLGTANWNGFANTGDVAGSSISIASNQVKGQGNAGGEYIGGGFDTRYAKVRYAFTTPSTGLDTNNDNKITIFDQGLNEGTANACPYRVAVVVNNGEQLLGVVETNQADELLASEFDACEIQANTSYFLEMVISEGTVIARLKDSSGAILARTSLQGSDSNCLTMKPGFSLAIASTGTAYEFTIDDFEVRGQN